MSRFGAFWAVGGVTSRVSKALAIMQLVHVTFVLCLLPDVSWLPVSIEHSLWSFQQRM